MKKSFLIIILILISIYLFRNMKPEKKAAIDKWAQGFRDKLFASYSPKEIQKDEVEDQQIQQTIHHKFGSSIRAIYGFVNRHSDLSADRLSVASDYTPKQVEHMPENNRKHRPMSRHELNKQIYGLQ